MQFNGVNNKERKCCSDQRCLFKHMRRNSMCSQNIMSFSLHWQSQAFACWFLEPGNFCFSLLPSPFSFSHLFISVMGASVLPQGPGGSWLVCQDLPATGAVSIQELAANSGSSCMDISVTQLPLSDAVVKSPKGL